MADLVLNDIDKLEVEKQYWWLLNLQNSKAENPPELDGLLGLLGAMKDQLYPELETEWSNEFQRERIESVIKNHEEGFATYTGNGDGLFPGREGDTIQVVEETEPYLIGQTAKDGVWYRIRFLDDGLTIDTPAESIAPYLERNAGISFKHNGLTISLTEKKADLIYDQVKFNRYYETMGQYVFDVEANETTYIPDGIDRVQLTKDAAAYYQKLVDNKGWDDDEDTISHAFEQVLEEAVERMPFAQQEIYYCKKLNTDTILFAELPMSGKIDVFQISLDISDSFESYVFVAVDSGRHYGYKEAENVARECVKCEHPDAPWVKDGLENSKYDSLTDADLGSTIDWQPEWPIDDFATEFSKTGNRTVTAGAIESSVFKTLGAYNREGYGDKTGIDKMVPNAKEAAGDVTKKHDEASWQTER